MSNGNDIIEGTPEPVAAPSKTAHHRVGSNILANWAGYGVNILVSFLISPFLVHNLGDVGYGIWALSLQLCGSMSILDIGLRVAVTRYLTHHHTKDEHEQVAAVFSSAFTVLSLVGLLVAGIGMVLSANVTSIFKIPTGMETSAQWAVFLIGLTVASTFPGALFGGALGALSRYDMLNLTSISIVVTRALLWWWVVKQGWGVVGVAAVRVLTDLVLFSIHAALAWRLYGGLRLRPKPGELKPNLRTLFSFSVYSFLLSISTRLVFASDKLVAGILLGPIAVTFYTIGISLTEHLRALLFASTSILVPLATSLDAKKDKAGLRNLLVQSSRMNFLLILPGLMAFFVIGTPFIELWMGLRYAETSGTILALLTIPVVFAPLRNTCSQLLYGMNRHRVNAFWSVGEAVANLGLSIFLAIKLGLIGIAIGTLIPAVIAQGFAVPIYTARYLGVDWPALYWRSLFRPALVAAPYAIVLVACRWLGFTKTWLGFFATVGCGLLVYAPLVWFGSLTSSEKEDILQRLRSIFRRTALSSAGAP